MVFWVASFFGHLLTYTLSCSGTLTWLPILMLLMYFVWELRCETNDIVFCGTIKFVLLSDQSFHYIYAGQLAPVLLNYEPSLNSFADNLVILILTKDERLTRLYCLFCILPFFHFYPIFTSYLLVVLLYLFCIGSSSLQLEFFFFILEVTLRFFTYLFDYWPCIVYNKCYCSSSFVCLCLINIHSFMLSFLLNSWLNVSIVCHFFFQF